MKKKLLFVIPSLEGGGAEKVILNLANNIDRDKFDVNLILLDKRGPYVQFLKNDIKVINLNKDKARKSIISLIIQINKIKPDLILSTLTHINFIIILIRGFLKGNPKIFVREANMPSKYVKNNKIYTYLYNKSDFIIAQCQEMKDDMIKNFNINNLKVKYIYNPLDIKSIERKKIMFNPYDSKKINFVSVGRLTFQKGFDNLIDTFSIINQKISNWKLTILGDGELKEELFLKIRKLNLQDKIDIVGFKENPYPYYYYSDMYILSSRYEGFPNTLLEALACKTKVIAYDCKSGPREILCDGKYGILVKEGDSNALANSILEYLNEENLSKDRALDFSICNIVKLYEELLLS